MRERKQRPLLRVPKRQCLESGLTLVELLISMSILAVVTTMILMGWFALQKSYASTTKSDQARVDAREGATRMVMEIRAAQALPGAAVLAGGGVTETSDKSSGSEWIDFWTTFNHPQTRLHTRYEYLWSNTSGTYTGSIYRIPDFESAPTRMWLVVPNVVNGLGNRVFRYLSVNAYGVPTWLTEIPITQAALARISAVEIHLMVDLNPGKSPTYMDIRTTAQLRNQRQY